MKQTTKTTTVSSKLTNLRLDPLSKARLEWLKAFYANKGEPVSASMVFRRAIEHLTDHLSTLCTGNKGLLDYELLHILSCTNNKENPFNGSYPWENLEEGSKIKSFDRYAPNKFVESLGSVPLATGNTEYAFL